MCHGTARGYHFQPKLRRSRLDLVSVLGLREDRTLHSPVISLTSRSLAPSAQTFVPWIMHHTPSLSLRSNKETLIFKLMDHSRGDGLAGCEAANGGQRTTRRDVHERFKVCPSCMFRFDSALTASLAGRPKGPSGRVQSQYPPSITFTFPCTSDSASTSLHRSGIRGQSLRGSCAAPSVLYGGCDILWDGSE